MNCSIAVDGVSAVGTAFASGSCVFSVLNVPMTRKEARTSRPDNPVRLHLVEDLLCIRFRFDIFYRGHKDVELSRSVLTSSFEDVFLLVWIADDRGEVP